jgi:acetylornithine deacetylase/succinyl-diaminopimelate desuccinylase-like protein
MKSHAAVATILVGALAIGLHADEQVDETIVARIKTEAFQHSRIMETLSELTDVYGARLRGSPAYAAAADWVKQRLNDWGFERVTFEPGGFTGPGWRVKRFSVEMMEPQYLHVNAQPLAWSPATHGRVSGMPILVEVSKPADFDKYRGKLKAAIVLNGRPDVAPATTFTPTATRYTDDELARGTAAIDPTQKLLVPYDGPDYAGAERVRREGLETRAAIAKFFRDEGVAAVLVASRLSSGVIAATDAGGFDLSGADWKIPNPNLAPPSFVLAREHYGRIARLVDRQRQVTLEVQLDAEIMPTAKSVNIIAEMPGSDARLADQVVMFGAHFDSWSAGTGATDNAAGSVVMMESLRILTPIGARPRRTIRLALWDAEEGGHLGSSTYVLNHFADPRTMRLKPEHAKLAAYYNFDNGTGKIRGVFLQGNEAVRPIFAAWLRPFRELGAGALAVQRVGGTDHLDFDHVGLPAFQFVQDPLDYETRTHHTNMDVLESIQEADLQQAAAIVATFVYHTAMRDDMLPRAALPKAPPY